MEQGEVAGLRGDAERKTDPAEGGKGENGRWRPADTQDGAQEKMRLERPNIYLHIIYIVQRQLQCLEDIPTTAHSEDAGRPIQTRFHLFIYTKPPPI